MNDNHAHLSTIHIYYIKLYTYLHYCIYCILYLTCVDGGIIANNPSIVAVSKAMAHYPFLNINNIAVLSLGAGSFPRHTNVFSAGRGTVVGASSLTG